MQLRLSVVQTTRVFGDITKLNDKHIIYLVYENNINFIHFQTFLLKHHMQTLTMVFRLLYVYLISSFLLLIYSML